MPEEASIRIDADATVPIYRQIVDQIRMHVDQATLSPGDPLPSVRSLATQLGVHFNTVAEAYRELAEEGWIDLNQGKRARVRKARSLRPLQSHEAAGLVDRLRNLVSEMRLKGISADKIVREVTTILER